ncbi:MAG: DNA mismatch repair protein MutS [Cryomorphaceae bacterium]
MRMHLDNQTVNDLEFEEVRGILGNYCHAQSAGERMAQLMPFERRAEGEEALDLASELMAVRNVEEGFPRLEFEELINDIKQLGIKGSVLDLEGFIRLLHASQLVNDLIYFFQKRKEEYPRLHQLVNTAYHSKEIIVPIEKVLDKRMKVKDDASNELLRLRQEIKRIRAEINKNFAKVLRRLAKDGFLADTVEAYINDRRVLSVLSNHKRQVSGNVLGASKTGNFTYIEPHENTRLNSELEMLLDDERAEIRRIFLALTDELRRHLKLIECYQSVLVEMDFIQAKVSMARTIGASRPAMEDEPIIDLIDAYHPLLLLANKAKGVKTVPQSLYMDKFCRMMVISGPNAGGKSITLKTVGLLQVMVQSGLLVPCSSASRFGWFHGVLSDIGDNQSIANQLSTYSYRLKRMNHFLTVANKRTLLLLDEFGTGSDPDLGGALAEVFFETLYNKRSYGVITTHYANIKLKAARLRNAVNASMLFNSESLEPLYQLSVGQPGSSFTFEVAQINGIPQSLIEEAKTRLDSNKVEMDKLIANLQKEKSEVEDINRASRRAEKEAVEAKEAYEELIEHYEQRLQKQQHIIEKNNKELSNGKRVGQFILSYRLKGHNKKLLEEVKKFLAIEKSKLVKKKEEVNVKKARVETKQQVAKKSSRRKKQAHTEVPPKPVEVGSSVRMFDGSQKGEVLEIKGAEATVLFGNFHAKVKLVDLSVVS